MGSGTLIEFVHRGSDTGGDDRLGGFGRAFDYRLISGKLGACHRLQ